MYHKSVEYTSHLNTDYLADTVTTLHTTTESTLERVSAITKIGKCES